MTPPWAQGLASWWADRSVWWPVASLGYAPRGPTPGRGMGIHHHRTYQRRVYRDTNRVYR